MDKLKVWNSFQLKIFACISMLASHFAFIFEVLTPWQYNLLQGFGRLAMPIFAFLIANGFRHTTNKQKYLYRLLIFGVIIQFPYQIFLSNDFFNIFFTLSLGLIAIILWENDWIISAKIASCFIICFIAEFVNVEYGFYGILMILSAHIFYDKFWKLALSWLAINSFFIAEGISGLVEGFDFPYLQGLAVLALPFLYLYNGQRGPGSRWFFYIFYIGHLAILYGLANYVF